MAVSSGTLRREECHPGCLSTIMKSMNDEKQELFCDSLGGSDGFELTIHHFLFCQSIHVFIAKVLVCFITESCL